MIQIRPEKCLNIFARNILLIVRNAFDEQQRLPFFNIETISLFGIGFRGINALRGASPANTATVVQISTERLFGEITLLNMRNVSVLVVNRLKIERAITGIADAAESKCRTTSIETKSRCSFFGNGNDASIDQALLGDNVIRHVLLHIARDALQRI